VLYNRKIRFALYAETYCYFLSAHYRTGCLLLLNFFPRFKTYSILIFRDNIGFETSSRRVPTHIIHINYAIYFITRSIVLLLYSTMISTNHRTYVDIYIFQSRPRWNGKTIIIIRCVRRRRRRCFININYSSSACMFIRFKQTASEKIMWRFANILSVTNVNEICEHPVLTHDVDYTSLRSPVYWPSVLVCV